jgi:hypothetical protein
MPERPLHDYMADVSKHAEIRMGVPLPMEHHEYGGTVAAGRGPEHREQG